MDRRQFLTRWDKTTRSNATTQAVAGGTWSLKPRTLSVGLEPYVPNASQPWDALRVGHLLRRTTFMPRWDDIQTLLSKTPAEAVDLLLNTTNTPAAPSCADHVTESLDGLDQVSQNALKGQWQSDAGTLRKWWGDAMRDSPLSISEKLTLFWSGHFTSEFAVDEAYVLAPLLYRQNKMLRENGLGNLKDLTMSVTLDPAMLVYLGGSLNSKGKPNENYARELLELFTTGLGWYTEGDVQMGARILTGWRVAYYSDKPQPNGIFATYFERDAHDTEAKQFLNISFPSRPDSTNSEDLVRREEVRKMIDTIFDQRADAVAKFIAGKLYRFFVYSSPTASDASVVAAIADLLKSSNFEIKPVIRAILLSAHFFDNANIGAQIKTPAEYAVGIARQLYAKQEIDAAMTSMDQTLFDPPNVSGWPGYHDWITTTYFPVRSKIAEAAVTAMSEQEILDLIQSLPAPSDPDQCITAIAHVLLPRPLATERKTALIAKMTSGAPSYEWTNIWQNDKPTAARNMRDALRSIVELPDFQLC